MDKLTLLHSTFTQLGTTVDLSGKNKNVHIENNLFEPNKSAIIVEGINDIRIQGNKIDKPLSSSFPLISILNSIDTIIGDTIISDTIMVNSNIINNSGNNSLMIENFKSFVNISGNEFTNNESSNAIKLNSFTGEVVVNDNNFNISSGKAIIVGGGLNTSIYENELSEKNSMDFQKKCEVLEKNVNCQKNTDDPSHYP